MLSLRRRNLEKEVLMVYKHRSAVTGRYVTEKYADKHPKTTVRERSK